MGALWDWFVGMDWAQPVTARGVLVGMIAGCIIGALFEAVAQKYRDVRDVKKRLDGTRKARWVAIKTFAGLGLLAVIAAAFMIGHDKPATGNTSPPPASTGR